MTVQNIIDRVRAILIQTPFEHENVANDDDVFDSPTTSISDANLRARVYRATLAIIGLCKASHVYDNIAEYTDLPTLDSTVDRPLTSRVFVNDGSNDIRAVRRSPREHRNNERAGRQASTAYPVYTLVGNKLRHYPSGQVGSCYVVSRPAAYDDNSDTIPLDERFRLALILWTVASVAETFKNEGLAQTAMALFDQEIDPYHRMNRYTRHDEDEVDTEG